MVRGFMAFAVLAMVVPAGLAVNPLDDDAGSGGDAGDTPHTALRVTPGRHAGMMTTTYDPMDTYSFVADAGQLLQYSVEGDVAVQLLGPAWDAIGAAVGAEAWVAIRDGTVVLPFEGPWYLRVQSGLNLNGYARPYVLEFSLSQAPAAAWSAGPEGWHVVEVRADEPRDLQIRLSFDFPHAATRPVSGAIAVEVDGSEGSYVTGLYAYRATLGDGVVVAGADVGLPGPLTLAYGEGSFGLIGHYEGFTGTLRLLGYHASAGSRMMLLAYADGPAAMAAGRGDDVVSWSELDDAGPGGVVAPGLAATGDRSVTLDVRDRFFGFVNADGAAATLTGPDGAMDVLDASSPWRLLRDPAEGPWRLDVAARTTVGLDTPAPVFHAGEEGATRNQLDGFRVPGLGVAPLHAPGLAGVPGICAQRFIPMPGLGVYDYPPAAAFRCP